MSKILQTEDRILREYQLDPNPLYEYPAEKNVKVLSTCPLNSQVRVINAPTSSNGTFNFDFFLGKSQFLSNVLQVHYRIPFIVEPTTPSTSVTAATFMTDVMGNNANICLAQHGVTQAEISTELSLNDQSIGIVNNIDLLSNIVSPYYQADDVDEFFQASQPDRFQSFSQYSGSGSLQLKYLNGEGKTVYTSITPTNEQNIFNSTYQAGYSSRTPQWEFGSVLDSTTGKCKVYCNFWSYLKFSIGATPNNEETLAGIERVRLTTRLHDDIAPFVFNIKPLTNGTQQFKTFTQDTSDVDNTRASLLVKIISPPQFMIDEQLDKASGQLKPYSIGYPMIVPKIFNSIQAGGMLSTTNQGSLTPFNQESIRLDSVPRSIYIALVKEKTGTFTQKASTPVNYGLISNLSVHLDDSITNFIDEKSLDYVTKSNGYDELDPVGKLIKGYPIKLNLGKDLALPRDLVVGGATPLNLSVSGNFYNQSTESANYKLVVVVVNDATLDFSNGVFSRSGGVYVPISLMSQQYFLRDLFYTQQKQLEVIGGGKFGDALKWFGRNAVKLAKNAWQNRDSIASTVGDVVSLAKTIKGGKVAYSNVSGSGNGTVTLGAGSVKSSIFK